MFYPPPPRQELAVRGEHRHPQVHRCSTQPSEKPFGRRPLKFFKNLRGARCAQERPPLCRSISRLEKFWKTVLRRSSPSGCSSTGRLGTGGRPANHTTRPAPSKSRSRQAALRTGRSTTAGPHRDGCVVAERAQRGEHTTL